MSDKARRAKISEFVGGITLTGNGRKIVLPTTVEDSKRQAQLEAAKLSAFIDEWMDANRENIADLKPQALKDLAAALKTKQEIAEKAYGKAEEAGKGSSNNDAVAEQAAKAISFMMNMQKKEELKTIDVEAEDVSD